jgi:hypothetical protein
MRKESGFAVSDRIVLTVVGGEDVQAVLDAHGAWIADEVLAAELVGMSEAEARQRNLQGTPIDLDGITARVAITRTQ